jgi:hypothetical protein
MSFNILEFKACGLSMAGARPANFDIRFVNDDSETAQRMRFLCCRYRPVDKDRIAIHVYEDEDSKGLDFFKVGSKHDFDVVMYGKDGSEIRRTPYRGYKVDFVDYDLNWSAQNRILELVVFMSPGE